MNYYEAITAELKKLVPTAGDRIYHIIFDYNDETQQYKAEVPAITYQFSNEQRLATHSGPLNVYKVQLDINLWGNLETLVSWADLIRLGLDGASVSVENVNITLVEAPTGSQDIWEINTQTKRKLLRFKGLIIVS